MTILEWFFFFRYRVMILKLPNSVLEWALNPRIHPRMDVLARDSEGKAGGRQWSE